MLIDFINPMDFSGGDALAAATVDAARRTATLREKARAEQIPVIYTNYHFGDWHSNFAALVAACAESEHGGPIVDLLSPGGTDHSILKPRHSPFYGSPLEFLLDDLEIDSLILTGVQTDICVLSPPMMRTCASIGSGYPRTVWLPRTPQMTLPR